MDANGNFVVTWTSSDGNGLGIYAQRFNAAGVKQGGEFRVNTTTTSDQNLAAVAMDAAGNFVISWTSLYQDGSGQGVYAQRYNAAGVAQGSEFRVNTTTGNNQSHSTVAMDTDGDFVVAWASLDGSGDGIYAQRYNAAGVKQGGEFRVNTFTNLDQKSAAAAMNVDGDFIVTWTSVGQDGDGGGIYAQRYNATGLKQGGEFRVNTTTANDQPVSTIAMDAAGKFVITWTSSGQDGSGWGVYAQRYNAAGVAQGSEFRVNTTTANDQGGSSVAMDAAGNFVVAWTSAVQDGSNYGVYAQRYNDAGVKQGGEFRVNSYTTGNQEFAAVAMDAASNYVVAWTSGGQDGSGYGVYAQRYAFVNHAPVGTTGTVTGTQNTAYAIKNADFGFTDPNDSPPNSLLAVKITTLPTAGTLTDNGTAVTVGQFVSAADISGGKLMFTPNTSLTGGPYFLCKFQVEDNGGTANGGANLDQVQKILYVKIMPANHAPIGKSGTVTTGVNVAYALKTSDFGFTDPNDTPPNSLLAVKFTLLPTTGTLKNNGVALTANQLVTAADISSGKLVFTPNTNLIGGPFFLCKFQVEDNGGTAGGGVNLDPTPKVLYVDIVKVNHAPQGTSGTVTGLKNTPYTLKTSDFGFSDPNDTPPNTLLAVKFTLLPGSGTLKDNGVALTANQLVSVTDISGGKLVYTPATGTTGQIFLCKFQVEDNGGTANGGVNLDPTARVLYIKLTP